MSLGTELVLSCTSNQVAVCQNKLMRSVAPCHRLRRGSVGVPRSRRWGRGAWPRGTTTAVSICVSLWYLVSPSRHSLTQLVSQSLRFISIAISSSSRTCHSKTVSEVATTSRCRRCQGARGAASVLRQADSMSATTSVMLEWIGSALRLAETLAGRDEEDMCRWKIEVVAMRWRSSGPQLRLRN